VEEAELEAGELGGLQLRVHFGGGAELGALWFLAGAFGGGLFRLLVQREIEFGLVGVGALDEGIDDVCLAAEADLLADEVPDFAGAFFRHATGLDGGAAGRHLVDDAGFKVTVEREREGARNRCCGHD
jgi:hypothetical protein